MDGVIDIPDGRMQFRLKDGRAFSLDPIETAKAINRIVDDTKGKSNFEYLDQFVVWVQQETQGIIVLTTSEADYLIDRVNVETAKAKKNIADTLKSLRHMEESVLSD